MKSLFSEKLLQEIKSTVRDTLAETFHVMFQLDIVISPEFDTKGQEDSVCSCIKMSHNDNVAYLSIATSKAVIDMICDQIEPGVTSHSKELTDDVIKEIVNIISNHLRTSFSTTNGIMFDLGFPKSCSENCIPSEADAFKVHFIINPDNKFNLDITHIEPNGHAYAV